MKVICIDDEFIPGIDNLYIGYETYPNFTRGKVYEILRMKVNNLDGDKLYIPYIKDDADEFHMYEIYNKHFTTIEENRDNKINQIIL